MTYIVVVSKIELSKISTKHNDLNANDQNFSGGNTHKLKFHLKMVDNQMPRKGLTRALDSKEIHAWAVGS